MNLDKPYHKVVITKDQIFIHSQYTHNIQLAPHINDIAVMKMKTALKFGTRIGKIEMVGEYFEPIAGNHVRMLAGMYVILYIVHTKKRLYIESIICVWIIRASLKLLVPTELILLLHYDLLTRPSRTLQNAKVRFQPLVEVMFNNTNIDIQLLSYVEMSTGRKSTNYYWLVGNFVSVYAMAPKISQIKVIRIRLFI